MYDDYSIIYDAWLNVFHRLYLNDEWVNVLICLKIDDYGIMDVWVWRLNDELIMFEYINVWMDDDN